MNIYKLGDIAKINMCKRVFSNQTSKLNEIPFYKIGTLGKSPDSFISRSLFTNLKKNFRYPEIGDTLISCSGTIGKIVEFKGEESYFQDSNIVWINSELFIKKYFFYWLNKKPFKPTQGGTIKRLYNSDIKNTSIFLPSLIEQQKIIDIIEPLEKANEILIKCTEKIAKLMEKREISLFSIKNYVDKWSNGYAYKKNDMQKNGNYKIYTIKNIESSEKFELTNFFKQNLLNIGNVTTGLSGTIGTAGIVVSNNWVSNQRLLSLNTMFPLNIKISIEKQKEYIYLNSTGAVQKNITSKLILEMPIITTYESDFVLNKLYLNLLVQIKKNELIRDKIIKLLIY